MVLSWNTKKMQAHCSYLKFCPVELELSFDHLLTQAVVLPQWSPPLLEHLKYCMGPPPLPPSTDPLQPSGWRTFHVPPPPCTLLLHPSSYFHSYWGNFATLALSGVKCFWEVIFFIPFAWKNHIRTWANKQCYCLNLRRLTGNADCLKDLTTFDFNLFSYIH